MNPNQLIFMVRLPQKIKNFLWSTLKVRVVKKRVKTIKGTPQVII